MKKGLVIYIAAFLFSCGKSQSGREIGEEVCNCSTKANALPVSDPNRTKAQNDCMSKQQKAWDKVKDDKKKADDFNKKLSECTAEQIKKSFGQ